MATSETNVIRAIGMAVVGVATGSMGAMVSQIPTSTEIGEFTKYGFAGGCGLVTGYLIVYLIPKLLDTGEHINESTRLAIEKGFADLGTKIDKGNEQVASLLQRALFNDRQTK